MTAPSGFGHRSFRFGFLHRGVPRDIAGTALACAAVVALGASARAQFAAGFNYRVSQSSAAAQANADVLDPVMSPEGRFAAYWSTATNLVPNDLNNVADVFLTDLISGETVLASLDFIGNQGDLASGDVGGVSLTPGGGLIAFPSKATMLTGVPTGGVQHVYVRDRFNGTTTLASKDSFGNFGNGASRAPAISAGTRFCAFQSLATNLAGADANGVSDIYVHDLLLGRTNAISLTPGGAVGNGASILPSISADGRYIAFESAASNLVPSDTNNQSDIFLRDRVQQVTLRVSVSSTGVQGSGPSHNPAVAGDGTWVAYDSQSINLVPNDTNGVADVFVYNRANGATVRASVNSGGVEANGPSTEPSISTDGRFVSFTSLASNLVANDTNNAADVFVHDFSTGTTELWSVSFAGANSDGASSAPSVSDDGCRVVYQSRATNLIANDTNGVQDVFLRECTQPGPLNYCTGKVNSQGCYCAMSFNGTPSASAPNGFQLFGYNVLNNKSGLLMYSTVGSQAAPFQGGTLCVAPPVRRTPASNSGGNPPPDDCSGLFTFDFNVHIASGIDPTLVLAQRVWTQFWSRDPGYLAPNNTNLTEAIVFTITP
jgi:Tol biopolymer transport system component